MSQTPPPTTPPHDPYAPPPKGGMRPVTIVLIVLGAVGFFALLVCGGLVLIMLPAMSKARAIAQQLKSSTNLREIHQAMIRYADDNRDHYPPVAGWQDALVDGGYLEPALLDSPLGDPDADGVVYVYVPTRGGHPSFDPNIILLYEDPDHTPGSVNVLFDDSHAETLDPNDFQTRLADQIAKQPTP